jgi:hypothetical protein
MVQPRILNSKIIPSDRHIEETVIKVSKCSVPQIVYSGLNLQTAGDRLEQFSGEIYYSHHGDTSNQAVK